MKSFHFEFSNLLALKAKHIVFWLGLRESSTHLFLTFHEVFCAVEGTPQLPVPHLEIYLDKLGDSPDPSQNPKHIG